MYNISLFKVMVDCYHIIVRGVLFRLNLPSHH